MGMFDCYVSPTGRHRHRCPECDFVWEHSDDCYGDQDRHVCPCCGECVFYRYHGTRPPDPLPERSES